MATDASIPVVLVTAHGDVAMAVLAMRNGAYDFVEKPFAPERFVDALTRALGKRVLRVAVDELRGQQQQQQQLRSGMEAVLLGNSGAMLNVKRQVLNLS